MNCHFFQRHNELTSIKPTTMKTRLIILCAVLAFAAGCRKTEQVINNRSEPVDFLSDKKYKSLVVEIQYVEGYKPTDAAMQNLRQFLEARLHKPAGIAFVYNPIASPGKAFYDVSDAEKIERNFREEHRHGATAAAYFLFLDGAYARDEENTKVLGIAYGGSSVVMFGKTIAGFSDNIMEPSRSTLETAVGIHEFGHLLGLVNDGTGMVNEHQDQAHPHHCNNTSCIMYYKAETSDILGILTGNDIPELDQQCISDLQANGGK